MSLHLPQQALAALAHIAFLAVPTNGDAMQLVALLQPLDRTDPKEAGWRLFVAPRDFEEPRDMEYTWAGDLASDAVEPLRHAAILEEGEAQGRVILQLTELGQNLCRSVVNVSALA